MEVLLFIGKLLLAWGLLLTSKVFDRVAEVAPYHWLKSSAIASILALSAFYVLFKL